MKQQRFSAQVGAIAWIWGVGVLGASCVRAQPPTDPGFVAGNRDPLPADAGRNGDAKSDAGGLASAALDASFGITDGAAGSDDGAGPLHIVDGGATDAEGALDVALSDAPLRDVAPADAAAVADVGMAADGGDPLLRGLAAFYPFDEGAGVTAADVTGHGNQAALHNGAAWKPSTVVGAQAGNFAIELDGTDDYLDVPAAKLPSLGSAKSITFWLALRADAPAVVGSTQRTCLALLDADQGTGLQLGFDRDRPAAWNTGQDQGFVVAPAAPPPGFHHWGYTFDGTIHRLYLDGKSVATKAVKPPQNAVASLIVGTYAVPNEMCAGQLDDLRIYDRALGADEIASLATRP
jgi:hypothetical protein